MSNFLQRLRSQTFGGILGGEKGGTATPPDLSRSVQSSTAPLAVMERPKYSYGTVQYPEDLGTAEFGHYILFHIYQVSRSIYAGPQTYGPFLNGAGFRKDRQDKWHGTTTHEQKEGITSSAQVGYPVQEAEISRDKQISMSGGLRRKKHLVRTSDSIALYMPPNIKHSYKATYKNDELGLGGVIGQQLAEANSVDSFMDSLFSSSTANTLKDSISEVLGIKTALKIGGFLGAGDPMSAARKIAQKALNPALEAVFQSIDLRNFDFSFRFTPRSESEVKTVDTIIKLFKFHMHPERVQGQDVGRHLIFPGEFDIHYMYQGNENTWYPFTGGCVLNSCEVTYGPGGESQHFRPIPTGDGNLPAPTEINMTLNFTETEIMTKSKIKEGY